MMLEYSKDSLGNPQVISIRHWLLHIVICVIMASSKILVYHPEALRSKACNSLSSVCIEVLTNVQAY